MTPEQIRQAMGAIAEKIEAVNAGAEGYTAEQIEVVNALNEEFEALAAQLETAEKVEAMKAKASASAGRKTAPTALAAAPRVEVQASYKEQKFGGFNSTGDYLMAVKRAGHGELDKRFQNTAIYEKDGESGGFLVPEEMSAAILKKLAGDDSLMSKCTNIPVTGNSLTMNVDESQPWNQGIQAYWTAEGATISQSKPTFKQAQWRLQKLAAMVVATDEMLEDATAMGGYIQAAAPNAIMHKINNAIISGNGAGKPTGIINSPFAVTVAAESGENTDIVTSVNVIKMYSRMFPISRPNSAWYIHPQVEEQLLQLQDPNGNYIYLSPFSSPINQTPYSTLLGRPVIPLLGSMPALGSPGDIILADLSYFYMIQKSQGVKAATSIHLLFDKEQTAFRFTMRLDGKIPFTAPVTTEFGSYDMSAVVLLADR